MKSVIHVYTSNNSVENVYCAIEYNLYLHYHGSIIALLGIFAQHGKG